MTLLIEMVVNLCVNRTEFLQGLHAAKPLHSPLSSSKWLMRILRPIVEPSTNLLSIADADLFHCRGIAAEPIGHYGLAAAIFLHDAFQKLQRRSLVPLRGDHGFQDLAFVIDSSPEVAELAIDLHEHLIQVPTPLRIASDVRDPLFPDLGSEDGAKPVPPKPDCLVADVSRIAQLNWVCVASLCATSVERRSTDASS